MNNIQIMTAAEVRSIVTELNLEIEDGLINNAIKLTQQSVIKPSIGQEWFDQLLTQKSGGTYTIPNKYIVDNYLKYILAYSTWQYLVISLSLQINSAGLRIKVSEHSEAAQTKDIQYYRDFIQNWIDNTRKAMFRYIQDNKNLYPLYYNNKYNEQPKNNQYNWKIGGVGGIKSNPSTYIQSYNENK